MHAISYQLKRAHLCAVRIGQRLFAGTKRPDAPDFDGVVDMTPARFDILNLVYGKGRWSRGPAGWIRMAELHRMLGVARATIWKAIKRLRELGLVHVELAPGARRDKVVRLTREGVARLTRALHLVFTGRTIARHYQKLVRFDGRCEIRRADAPKIAAALGDLLQRIGAVARHHHDRSEALYRLRHIAGA